MNPDFQLPITRPVSGFSLLAKDESNPLFKSTDILTQPPGEYLPDGTPVWGRCSALSEAQRNRLVEAAKCPTHTKAPVLLTSEQWLQQSSAEYRRHRDDKAARLRQSQKELNQMLVEAKKAPLAPKPMKHEVLTVAESRKELRKYRRAYPWGMVTCYDPAIKSMVPTPVMVGPKIGGVNADPVALLAGGEYVPTKKTEEGRAGQAYTVVTHRQWSDEYRIRTQLDMCHQVPPEQSGDRVTYNLSMGGASKIADSCHYMHLKKGGYQTFFTLTFSNENRAKIAAGETTIQKEIGRLWDGLNKMRRRGWQYTTARGEVVKVPAEDSNVHYCWVVENPLNEAGERNPHVHILMDWKVDYDEFRPWAARLEGIWKQGTAHLEKIKDSENAGAYMAKAAGYLSKASGDSDQGPVRGNRYGISRDSRAPDWVQVGRYEMGIMGHLITDVHHYFSALYGDLFAERAKLNRRRNKAIEDKRPVVKRYVGRKLAAVRNKLNELPAIASKYQILIKDAFHFEEFIQWASGKEQQDGNEWLPPKSEGDAWKPDEPRPDSNWLKEFQFRMFAKRAARRFWGMPLAVYQSCVERAGDREQEQYDIFNSWVQYQVVE